MDLQPGATAPLFVAPASDHPTFSFGVLGGRYILLAFLPEPGAARDGALAVVRANAQLFHDERMVFYGVLPDEASFAAARHEPPCNWFADFSGKLRRAYGAVDAEGAVRPLWVLVDPMLRILETAPLDGGPQILERVAQLGDPDDHAGASLHAPVLLLPRVFEPDLCRRLIDHYAATGGRPSGVMRQEGGKTVEVLDDFKKRRDVHVEDADLQATIRDRISRNLAPQIRKAFQFGVTRMERFLVACYAAEDGGYFKAHRDNTTPATLHRRFAVSINLNAEEFEGGDLRFPEFGRRTYRPPTGGAVVFSCSLLHEATPVTSGLRYAFLPFLFDEEGERQRQANKDALGQP